VAEYKRQEMIKQCLGKASEIVDVINKVPSCSVWKVLKAEPLNEEISAIRLDITFTPQQVVED
jgi:hypothetical protein